ARRPRGRAGAAPPARPSTRRTPAPAQQRNRASARTRRLADARFTASSRSRRSISLVLRAVAAADAITRRRLLRDAVVGGAALTAGPALLGVVSSARASAPPVDQLRLTFASDPSRGMTVSWTSDGAVGRPVVRYGPAGDGFGAEMTADTVAALDADDRVPAALRREVRCHHATLERLRP